jgi:hypothetical protein
MTTSIRTFVRRAVALVPAAILALAACKPAPNAAPCPATLADLPADQQGAATLTCSCPANAATASGSVWGNGTYTTDSNICRSAAHAGAVSGSGGNITLKRSPGCPAYGSSSANGVTSETWGPWGSSFYFDGKGSGACAASAAAN